MTLEILAAIASLPVFTLLFLMVARRWPASKAMPLAWLLTMILALFVWRSPVEYIAAVNVKGINEALEILLIIFGALVLLFTLKETGALDAIKKGFESVSVDRRVQTILIAWLFGAFIEGAAGFGTTAALVSPLLVSLGFPALAAVMVALIANTTAISFGPVGVPTTLGLGTALNKPEVNEALLKSGMNFHDFIYTVSFWTAVLHSVMAIFVPLMAVAMLTRYFGKNKSFKDGLSIWPYALFAGLCFALPYLITARILGPEFPSLFGSLIGLSILLPLTKKGFLVPKNNWDFPEREKWEEGWSGSLSVEYNNPVKISLIKAWIPYLFVGILLVITRLDALPFKSFLKQYPIKFNLLFGIDINSALEPLFNPGLFPFIFIALLIIPVYKLTSSQAAHAWKEASKKIKEPVLALIFAVPMVEVMQVGHSPQGWDSMPIVIAHLMSQIFQGAWPLIAPFIGAFGAFVAGSNTVSNMLFGLFQYSAADKLGISHIIVVSLQNVGGAFGVLICFFKIITAGATVGLVGKEGILFKRNLLPLIIYGLVVGITGMLLIYYIVPGLF
jgi:lactate permease